MSGDTAQVVWSSIASIIVGGGGAGALVAYIKDRKKTNADGQVASATVELRVDAIRMQNLEARFDFAQKAWDRERISLMAQNTRLEGELADERLESERRQAKIIELEERVAEIATELAALRTHP